MRLKLKKEQSFEETIEIELQVDMQIIESLLNKVARELNHPKYRRL